MDVINELSSFGIELCVHDPIADKDEALKEYDIELVEWDEIYDMDAIVLCVAHGQYQALAVEDFAQLFDSSGLIIDVKAILDKDNFTHRDIYVWRL